MDVWLVGERGFTIDQLMAVAGQRVAEVAFELSAERELTRIVLLIGPGNNGGDAVVAGEHLRRARLDVVDVRPLAGDVTPPLDAATLVIDGLFGVGLSREIAGVTRSAVEAVGDSPATVLSIDVPSGLCATTGTGDVVVRSDVVVTFVGPKAGFFLGRGPDLVRDWRAVDIGFPIEEAERWVTARRAGAG